MAADGTIFVEVDPTGAVVGSRRVKKSLDDIGDAADRNAVKSGRLKKGLGEISKGLIGPLGLAAAAGVAALAIKNIVNVAATFEKTVSELSAITGATGEDLKFLSDRAKEFGSTTTSNAIEVAEAFKLVGSAKPELLQTGDALAAVTRDAITLSEASGLTLPEAVMALTGALNQFNAGAEESSRFINVLAAGSKLGATEIPQLTESLKVAGTIAAGAGLSFEETVAAIELMGEAGLKGAEAGTQLRNVILRLNKQGVEELSPSVVGLSQALKNLEATELSGLTVLERNIKLEKIFGAETIAGAGALLVRAQRQEDLTKAVAGTNIAQEQAAINTANFEGQSKKLDAAFVGLQIAIGENFLPLLTQMTADLAVTIRFLNDGVSAAVRFGEAIGDALNTTDSIIRRAQSSTAEVIQAQLVSEFAILKALEDPERIAEQSKLIVGLQKALEVAKQREKPVEVTPPPQAAGVTTAPGGVTKATKEQTKAAREAARAAVDQQKAFEQLFAELKPLEQAQLDLAEANKTLLQQEKVGKITTDERKDLQRELNETFSAAIDPVEALNKSLQEEIALAKLSNEEKATEVRVQQAVNALKEAGVADAESHREAIRGEVEEIARLTEIQNMQVDSSKKVNEELELQKSILDEIRGPQEDMNNRLMALSSLLARDAITLEEFNAKLQDLRKQTLAGQTGVEAGFERGFIQAQENLNDFASLSEKIVTDSFKGMEDVMVNFAKTGKIEIGSLVDSILADFVRLQARQALAGALGSSDGKGGGSGILGLVGGLFSSTSGASGPLGVAGGGGGGSATSGSGSTFANLASLAGSLFASNQDGGIERSPTISTLAENGPEAIIPLKGGKVPVEVIEPSKPPININNTFNIATSDVASFGRSTGQVGQMMGQAFQSALSRNS